MIKTIVFSFIILSTGQLLRAAEPADSILRTRQLDEIEVVTTGPRKVVRMTSDGGVRISASMLAEQPSMMGSNDPMVILRTLPAVGTANDLSPAITVRGGTSGSNLFESDGARVFNPMHMLGLYSAFNPAFYSGFSFQPAVPYAYIPNHVGARFGADSYPATPDSLFSGSVSAGLIESHGAVRVPIKKGISSITVGARTSYLNLLFPNVLTLGTSKLDYGFTDVNTSYCWQPSKSNRLDLSLFYNHDRMNVENRENGNKDGEFGWSNWACNVLWTHEVSRLSVSFSRFNNSFSLSEGGREISLPSEVMQANLDFKLSLRDFTIGSAGTYRYCSGQRSEFEYRWKDAVEWNFYGDWEKKFFSEKLYLNMGLRLAMYHCSDFNNIVPLPRIRVFWKSHDNFGVYAGGGSYIQFDRLVEETTGGLPADFFINAHRAVKPETAISCELGLRGRIPFGGFEYCVEGYYRRMRHACEFGGSLIDLANSNYDPMADLMDGNGYATGVSVSLMRQWGKLRGRLSYNLGKSRVKFSRYGNTYFPASHDRPHDLNVSASWTIVRNLTLSASFVYATGTPYTKAKYGYMIGENLICEYYPHNSSRLPSYKRLDASLTWNFLRKRAGRHAVNISVYNVLASKNILFSYTSYSLDNGIELKESVMKSLIPSVSYTYEF